MHHEMISQNEMVRAIVALLKQNNRVIVPNFGAFIMSQGSSDKVLFNNFLSFNDGLLIGHICQEHNVVKSDALIEVNNFVELIRSSLDSKGEINFEGLGIFTKDHHNVLRFTQDIELRFADYPSFEKPAVTKPTEPKDLLDIDMATSGTTPKDEEPVVDNLPPSTGQTRLLTIDADKPEAIFPPTVKPDDEDINFEKAKKDEPTATYVPPTKVEKPINPKYQQPIKPSKDKKEAIRTEKKKRSMAWFVLVFILVPLLALVYYIGVHQNKYGWFSKTETKVTEQPKVLVKPIAPPATTTPEPTKTEPQVAPSTGSKKYHIIVSTKSNEADAQAYAQKLIEKGFTNAQVIARKGRFLVSIDAGDELVGTELRQEEIVNKYRIESYLLTVK